MKKNGLSEFLRQYRSEQDMSREALAEILDISTPYLASLETGTRKPAYGTLVKIINTLEVSADEVLGTDGRVGKILEETELSNQLNKLSPLYRKYAVANIKLILESFSGI